ncbi:MAG: methionine ABC transporter ATP-binding protein [Bacillota bacterium]
MISIRNLSKKFKSEQIEVSALENINLDIKKGEIFGIIGPSGAGKSTLIRTINLLEKPTTGQIKIHGQELTGLAPGELRRQRQKMGMIFQHFNLLTSRTVAGNVSFPLEIAGVKKKERRQRVERLLELVGLSEKAASYPAKLSGGQKQRVGVARALANNPEVLLSDEATSSLDPESTGGVLDLLGRIRDELNLTIILITHEMEVIKEICDRVAVIEGGEIVEKGPVIDIFARPQQPITRRFIKNIINFDLPPRVEEHLNSFDHQQGELIRVNFVGDSTHEPLISNVIKKYDVDANILYGNIDEIQDTPFGTLVLKLEGEYSRVKAGIDYLEEQGLIVEVLKDDRSDKFAG